MKKIELTLESQIHNCTYIGNIDLLEKIDFAFLCSSKYPGNIIIKIQEQAFLINQYIHPGCGISS
jgi:hypothetical protein